MIPKYLTVFLSFDENWERTDFLGNYSTITWQLPDNYLTITWQLLGNYLANLGVRKSVVYVLPAYKKIFRIPLFFTVPGNYLTITWQLLNNYGQIPDNFSTISRQYLDSTKSAIFQVKAFLYCHILLLFGINSVFVAKYRQAGSSCFDSKSACPLSLRVRAALTLIGSTTSFINLQAGI